jgi:hypothetical protein
MIVPMIDLGMNDADKHINRKKHTEYMTPTLSGTCYAVSLDVSYRVYQRECRHFKHLQLREEKRYGNVGNCSVIINSNSFIDASCAHPNCS